MIENSCPTLRYSPRNSAMARWMRRALRDRLGADQSGKQRRVAMFGHNRALGACRVFRVRHAGLCIRHDQRRIDVELDSLWHRALSRRSQKGRVLWERMRRLIDRYLPPAHIHHPYPLTRLGVIT